MSAAFQLSSAFCSAATVSGWASARLFDSPTSADRSYNSAGCFPTRTSFNDSSAKDFNPGWGGGFCLINLHFIGLTLRAAVTNRRTCRQRADSPKKILYRAGPG